MAERVSVKTVTAIFLLCTVVLVMYACIEPVDIDAFMTSDEAAAIIAAHDVKVEIIDETGDNLRGISGKITGLKNDRYYMVEKETNESNALVNPTTYPKYVTDYQGAPGELRSDLGLITRISGGDINNLTDKHTYTVRAAVYFSNSSSLTYTDGIGTSATQITGGIVNINEINGNGSLDLSGVITGTYKAMAVSVNGSQNSWNWTSKSISNWSSFPLEGPNTEVDYVFVKENTPSDFKVLKVLIGTTINTINLFNIPGVTPPATGAVPVTFIESTQYTGSVTWSPTVTGTFADTVVYTATITLNPKTGFTLQGVTANSFKVSGANSVSNAANSGVVTAIFPVTVKKPINIAEIPGVTAPKTGKKPVDKITDTEQYTGSVTWSPTVTGTFADTVVYTATITLNPKTGFTLQGVTANFFKVSGADLVSNTANSGVVTARFPITKKPQDITFDITLTVPTPSEMNAPIPSYTVNSSIERGDLSGTTSSVTLTLNGTWNTSTIKWSINTIIDETISIKNANGKNTLIITNGGDFLPVIAGSGNTSFRVYVYAEKTDGTPYSAYIEVPVTGIYTP